jgi:hypothetical protein
VIWPFLFALVLGGLISAALYHAYLWPAVEPEKETQVPATEAVSPEPEPEAEVRGPTPEPDSP